MVRGHISSRFVPFRPVVAVLAALVLALVPLVVAAQDASPVASPEAGTWVGQEPDLAAMVLTPADLEEIGLPGFGKFFNGFFGRLADFAENEAGFLGKPVEETRAFYEGIGWSRFFGVGLGLPSVPGEESPPRRGAFSNVLEVADAAGADAFLDFTTTIGPDTDWTIVAGEAPFSLGQRAVVIQSQIYDPEAGETFHEHYAVFQMDNLLGIAGFWVNVPDDTGTPEATPVPGAGTSEAASPAATVEEIEALGRRQLEKMEAVMSGGAPNLPALLLRLGDDPLDATANYSEGYRLLDGDLPPYYAGFEDDILADPAAAEGADAVYELEEAFQRGDEEAPGDPYFLTRLYRFPDEAGAEAFMAGRPDAVASGGFMLATGATDEARAELLPGEAEDLGDESMAFAFVRAFDDGGRFEGYEIYVRVGEMVAAVSLEGPPDMPLAQVTELAEAQAACLEAGECREALPVPESFRAPLPGTGTPEATPAA